MIEARSTTRGFTLIELLCAMAVLLVLMAVLFQFLSSADRAWRVSAAGAGVHQSAQILFDIITRDLESAVFSDEPGHQIPFYVGTNAGADELIPYLGFVAATDPPPVPGSNEDSKRLVEVHYKCRRTPGTAAEYPYWFRRSVVPDKNAAGALNPLWDFYGNPTGSPFADASCGTVEQVVYGVTDLAFVCYGRGGNTLASTACASSLPAAVRVTVTLFDPNLTDAPEPVRAATYRTFSKLIFLGRQ